MKVNRVLWLTISVAALLSLLCCASPISAKLNEQGWEFLFEHEDHSRHRVTVWKDGLCIDDGNCLSFYFANKTPDMKLICDENKTYMDTDLKSLKTSSAAPPLVSPAQQYYVKQIGKAKISGLDAIQFKGFDKQSNTPLFSVWTTTNIGMPAVQKAACQLARVPIVSGLPIRAERYWREQTKSFLKLISVKRAPVDLSSIDRAKRYARSRGLFELIFSESGGKVDKQDLERIFQQPLK